MSSSISRRREDGRQPLLVYLDPELITALKTEALQEKTHAYLIVEQLLKKRFDVPAGSSA